jgi:hypothetical protein
MSDPAPSNGTAFRLRHLETTVEAAVRDVNSLKIGQAITDRQLDVADDVGAMRKAAEVREQRDVVTVRWRIGTALAVIAAIISAAAIVASAIPS